MVDFEGFEATVEVRRWTVTPENPGLQDYLNDLVGEPDGMGYDPDPDFTLAEQAIKAWGSGRIVRHDERGAPDSGVP